MKIAFVARTKGLEYDDRIRKECLSLSKRNDIFIYVNFEDNRLEEGVTSYGIPFKSFKLVTRDKLPSSKFLLIKSFEFYLRVSPFLYKYDLIWAHEEYTFMFPLFSKRGKCIWDLHEIPFRFERKGLKRVFNFIENKSKKIIHANKFRIEYLQNAGVIKNYPKHDFIRNYPDKQFVESTNKDVNFDEFKRWLNGSDYAYLQGLSIPKRYPFNTVDAILKTKNIKAIVVGNFESKALSRLQEKYGDKLKENIFFAGLVDQLSIPKYLKNAKLSIILYDKKTPNNRYCEPNRLYQSIIMKVPVVVGNNEPMKEIVEFGDYGIVLKTEGEDVKRIINAIESILIKHSYYSENTAGAGNKFLWEDTCIKSHWYE
ncbi:glycosyltransferase family 4 protein [Flagellimonas hymeniacidonis]|uniref:Glycosyltransferase family 4 protein n=1 Tax=Flagellimonas hymeniacidonis TaxID=2603628 RepID=A0A5C8V6V5_9FLAO|nr:glycosyltransferase [Flagellimonas hymeniacidonis]TXN37625.1 glycosyltransferase family 4 protein [Flagellimonas hymeniacidonis]